MSIGCFTFGNIFTFHCKAWIWFHNRNFFFKIQVVNNIVNIPFWSIKSCIYVSVFTSELTNNVPISHRAKSTPMPIKYGLSFVIMDYNVIMSFFWLLLCGFPIFDIYESTFLISSSFRFPASSGKPSFIIFFDEIDDFVPVRPDCDTWLFLGGLVWLVVSVFLRLFGGNVSIWRLHHHSFVIPRFVSIYISFHYIFFLPWFDHSPVDIGREAIIFPPSIHWALLVKFFRL